MVKAFKEVLDKLIATPVTAVLYSCLVLYLCILPSQDLPQDTNDKVAHLLAFLGVSFLWQAVSGNWKIVLPGGTAFAIAIEVIRAQLPESYHRSGDWQDVVADVLGLLIGFAVLALYRKVAALFG